MEASVLEMPLSRNVPDGHSPDAASRTNEVDPALMQARLLLNSLIGTSPKGSIPMVVDAAMATALLERNEGNRTLNEGRVNAYAAAIKRGEWKHNGEAIKVTRCGLLNDGQHRCAAVVRAGASILTDVRFGLARDTFDTLDVGSKRTAADVLTIAGYKNAAIIAATARLYWRYLQTPRMVKVSPTHQQLEELVTAEPMLIEAAAAAVRSRGDGLLSGSVIGLGWLLAAKYDRAKADAFFAKVSNGVGISKLSEPAGRIRQAATNNAKSKGRWPVEYAAALVIKAWNAHAVGKGIETLRWRTEGDAPELFPKALEN